MPDNKIIVESRRLILASASPRRSQLLAEAGFTFEIIPSTIDEKWDPKLSPEENVKKIALEKATDVARKTPRPFDHRVAVVEPSTLILAADTIVVLGTRILEKPRDKAEASQFLKLLSGRTHSVLTGYTILEGSGTIAAHGVEESKVSFKILNDDQIGKYIQTGEPMDKAGAYAAQGIGSQFIEKIEGSLSNVIGLPMEVVAPILKTVMSYEL
ncbi:MAG TPA: septum formation protein Maf [Deltaproteobacteria bacterium]|nr:MAG: septum formation protein Maf [Deltaproteobacteria bacterium GWA2_45_12]HBF11803.1 septum formation protein Maf [Deltaproteobacteria bacterium]